MAVHIDIYTRLVDRDIDRVADQIRGEFERVGVDVGERLGTNIARGLKYQTPQIEQAFDRVADASGRARVAQERYDESIRRGEPNRRLRIQQEVEAQQASREHSRALRDLAREFRDLDRNMLGLNHTTDSSTRSLSRLEEGYRRTHREADRFHGNVGLWASRNLGALTPLGTVTPTLLIPMGLAFTEIANGAVAASESIALLPAVVTAAGAGIGTLKLATSGFGDTIQDLGKGDLKKFAEDIQGLAPNAQQAALTMQRLLPMLTELRKNTQQSFFEGFAEQIHRLSTIYEPTIEKMTVGIATAFNKALRGVSDSLATPEGFANMQTITENITRSFEQLAPVLQPVSQVFLDLTAVGSGQLPGIFDDIAGTVRDFAGSIRELRESGRLQEIMQNGWEAVKAVTSLLFDLGKQIYRVFGLDGPEAIEKFKQTMYSINQIIGTLIGAIRHFFEDVASVFRKISDTGIGQLVEDLGGLENAIAKVTEAILVWKVGGAVIGAVSGLTTALGVTLPAAAEAGAARTMAALNPIAAVLALIAASAFFGDRINELAPPGTPSNAQLPGLNLNPGQYATPPGVAPPSTGQPTPGSETRNIPGTTAGERQRQRRGSGETWVQIFDPSTGQWRLEPQQTSIAPAPPPPPPPPPNSGAWWGDLPVPPPPPGGKVPFNPPADQWSLGNVPLGAFPGATWQMPPGANPSSGYAPPGYGMPPPGSGPGYFQVDQQAVMEREWNVQKAKEDVEAARRRVLEIMADNNASEDDKIRARQNVVNQEHDLIKAQNDLVKEQQGTFKKLTDQSQGLSDAMGDIGASLDKDFGISKGLPGIADNIVRFLASLAFAPALGALAGVRTAAGGVPAGAGGLIGMAAVSGMFGQQYVPGMNAAGQLGYGKGYGGPGGLQGLLQGSAAGPYGKAVDAALLSNVPAGRYVSEPGVGDLTQGIGDCTSAVEDLVNIMDGRPTGGRSLSTGNADQWLQSHGFMPGPGGPGDFRVGFNNEHMQATLPGGTPFNWGSPEAAAQRGVGGTGAFDPAFTSNYYRPVSAGMGQGQQWSANWDAMAQSESSGNWAINTGNGYSGGLQFSPSSWNLAGGQQYAPAAYMATPAQQKMAAENLLAIQGPGAWPNTFQSFAAGGAIPIMAHAGEHMLTASDVKAMGGQSGVYSFRNALHYDAGGPIPMQPPPVVPPGMPPGIGNAIGAATAPSVHQGTGAAPGPSQIGGPAAPQGVGSGIDAGGGLLGAAESLGAAALNVLAPGAGIAAQIGIQEINRAIKAVGQYAGIGIGALQQTFSLAGSDLASHSWLARIGGAVVGATPDLPNMAGKPSIEPTPEQVAAQAPPLPPGAGIPGQNAQHGMYPGQPGPPPEINITYNNNRSTEDRAGVDIAHNMRNMYQGMMPALPGGSV